MFACKPDHAMLSNGSDNRNISELLLRPLLVLAGLDAAVFTQSLVTDCGVPQLLALPYSPQVKSTFRL